MPDEYAFTGMNIEDICDAIELAMKHGKQPGESFLDELQEIMKQKGKEIKFLGSTDDPEMLQANMRENGIHNVKRVLNLKNIMHPEENEDDGRE